MSKLLHEVKMIDHGKGKGCHVSELKCIHCGKSMELGDAFSTVATDKLHNQGVHKDRSGFVACKGKDNG